jgi:hypothetical protein
LISREKIIEKLISDGDRIVELFTSLAIPEWSSIVYFGEYEWQVKDILAHFISAEQSFIVLFDSIRISGLGVTNDFTVDDYNNAQILKLKGFEIKDLIDLFKKTRNDTVIWVSQISEHDFEKVGRHPALGETKIFNMIRMISIHTQMHLKDLHNSLPINKK